MTSIIAPQATSRAGYESTSTCYQAGQRILTTCHSNTRSTSGANRSSTAGSTQQAVHICPMCKSCDRYGRKCADRVCRP